MIAKTFGGIFAETLRRPELSTSISWPGTRAMQARDRSVSDASSL